MKNDFYFMLKALFILEISKFLCWLFDYLEKQFDKKAMVNFKIYKYKFINLNWIFQIKLTLKGPL